MTISSKDTVSVIDVASVAGVSLGTVSNVLNRPDKVSAETRERVERAMKDLGFIRNESARQLRAGRSNTLAYVVLDPSNPFFTDVAQGVDELAREHDLSLFLCGSANNPAREAQYLSLLQQQRVRGILLTPAMPESAHLDAVAARTPLVLVDRTRSDNSICSVATDDVAGGRMAVEHLIDLGHRQIAFAGGRTSLGQVRDRLFGAQSAASSAGLPESSILHLETDGLRIDDGRKVGQVLAGIPSARRPTATFCVNDLVALGLLQHAIQSGIRVPQDLAIVGFDDIEFAGAAAVPLTSVRQPRAELGRAAAELVLEEEAHGSDHTHRQVTFDASLVARASTLG